MKHGSSEGLRAAVCGLSSGAEVLIVMFCAAGVEACVLSSERELGIRLSDATLGKRVCLLLAFRRWVLWVRRMISEEGDHKTSGGAKFWAAGGFGALGFEDFQVAVLLRSEGSFPGAPDHAEEEVKVAADGGQIFPALDLPLAPFSMALAGRLDSFQVGGLDVLLMQDAVLLPAPDVVGALAVAAVADVKRGDPAGEHLLRCCLCGHLQVER